MSNSEEHDALEGIAVIGMSGRFPGAKNVDEFWRNLRDGVESIIHFSQQELEEAGIDESVLSDPQYVRAGGYLEDVDLFDAPFFGFNPREAEITDPQHRLFLECAWEALENAGYDSERYEGAIGVYAGVGLNSYLMNLYSNRAFISAVDGFQLLIGNDKDHLPTRVSYKLNLRGPSVTVQTSCSTSLVAINLACQSLQNYQCDMALAGGVRIIVPQKAGYFYREGGIASPDGHCRAFDAGAQGAVAGSGAAIVVLKRLADAIEDGDQVLAVIKGAALNNDGFQKIGYTAPSVQGQAEVIMMAQALAGVETETITYVEAHGTGTPLGDPIEVKALTQAFRATTQKKNFCAIGSVKTNIGHLDAAAGVTGLIKTVLALRHQQLPPSLHYQQPNPEIDFANSPFYVNARLAEWKAGTTPRRAGVSSFGIGGTNAHLVVEEASEREESGRSREWQLLLLSAKTESALDAATANLAAHLKEHPDLNLADVARTLQVGRRQFAHRRVVVCRDAGDAVAALETLERGRVFSEHREAGKRPVVFMFPGQGSQHVNMGRELYQAEPVYRREVDQCSELLKSHMGFDLREVLNPRDHQLEKARQRLNQTAITQPAVFVVAYALAKMWMDWGVSPEAMIGHSIGEYVAACLAGVFSLEDALALVAARGQLMQQLPRGAMLSVGGLTEEDAHRLRSKEIAIAAVNGPGNYVLSGAVEAVDALEQELTSREVGCRRLRTSHAFHSEMMEPILERFTEQVKRIHLQPPRIPYLSNVTGTWMQAQDATRPGYWARHLRQTVLFAEGLEELFQDRERILLEVGPGQTLYTLARQHPERERGQLVLSSLSRVGIWQPEGLSVLNTLGKLWLGGAEVDWKRFSAHERRHRVALPTYPFERQRYWVEKQRPEFVAGLAFDAPLSKKNEVAEWFYLPTWKRTPPPHLARRRETSEQKTCWLIFTDECGLGARMAERLIADGHDVVSVMRGTRFDRLSDNLYTIDARERSHYEDLFVELRAQERDWHTIVHMWNVTPHAEREASTASEEEFQDAGFYSLLHLMQTVGEQVIAQALQESSLPASLRIEVITNNMQPVTGDEQLWPEKATVLGPCRVIPQEYPNVSCRSIDITLPAPQTWQQEKLIEQLLAEVATEVVEPVVAYRGNNRWIQMFDAAHLPEPDKSSAPLRDEGTYLITGGMGGIGLVLAEYLATTARAKLVLVGRSTFPGREEWTGWLESHDEQDAVSRKIRKLQALEEAGAQVLVLSADVADMEQMREVVDETSRRFGRVHGVIHAAGNPPAGLIQIKTREMAEAVLAPKVKGTRILDALFKDAELDFFILYSSLSSILGYAGRADYAAANAFLDAFAHQRSAEQPGRLTVSINWDGWQEVGMGINYALHQNLNPEDALEEGMLSPEALDALMTILGSRLSQVVVSVQDFEARMARNRASSAGKFLEQMTKKGLLEPNHPRPNLGTPYVAPRNQVEQIIADIWQHILGIEQVGIHDNFFELGGDSIISIQFIARANKAGLRLTPKQVFEHQTIAEMAGAAGTTEVMQAEQGIVTGPVPLTPIQQRFFEQHTTDQHHFNQSFMFEVHDALPPSLVEKTLQYLLGHHDALRLSFVEVDGRWEQVNMGFDGATPFSCIDLSELPGERQREALEAAAAATQLSLDLTKGPLVRLVLFDMGAGQPMRLLISIHHLAVDGVSWRILLEDMQTIFEQLKTGQTIDTGLKTTSLKAWAERLAGYANSDALAVERAYWLDERRERLSGLLVDYPESLNTEASARVVNVSLSVEETQALLQEVPQAFHTQINEVLMTALAQSCAHWTGMRSMVVDLEGHGREAIFEDVDLSRTVGWFTTIFPVLFDIEEAATPLDELKLVKEQLRSVPNRGIGYGVLRYLSEDAELRDRLSKLPQAGMVFLYLGQLDQALAEASTFGPARESVGALSNPLAERSHLLEISGSVVRGELKMAWRYSENLHRRSTIERLADGFVAALRTLIALSRTAESVTYMPSDFADAGLDQKELDELIAELTTSEGQI